jgi:hypothetical protein
MMVSWTEIMTFRRIVLSNGTLGLVLGGLNTCCVGEVCVHFFLRALVESNKLSLKVSRGLEVTFVVS